MGGVLRDLIRGRDRGPKTFVKQRALQQRIKPRGQLSGRIAKTTDGKAINDLAPTQIVVSANSPTGHVGPWFK